MSATHSWSGAVAVNASCTRPEAPDSWIEAPASARAQGVLSRDQCYLPWDDRGYTFIRGHVVLPVLDRPDESFVWSVWSVWSTLAPEDMETVEEHWDVPRRGDMPAMDGRLANVLPYEATTLGLSLRVHNLEPGAVPHFTFADDVQHPLADEQRHGITWYQVPRATWVR